MLSIHIFCSEWVQYFYLYLSIRCFPFNFFFYRTKARANIPLVSKAMRCTSYGKYLCIGLRIWMQITKKLLISISSWDMEIYNPICFKIVIDTDRSDYAPSFSILPTFINSSPAFRTPMPSVAMTHGASSVPLVSSQVPHCPTTKALSAND